MAGRGRGRGRGAATNPVEIRPGGTSNGHSTPNFQSTTIKEPVAVAQVDKFDELCGEFKSLKLTCDDSSLTDLANKAKDLSKSDDHYFKIIDLLYQKVFHDNEFSAKVAKLGNILSSLDEVGGKFRSCLLKRAQEHYKNRENLNKDAASEWTGLFYLLCEIFKVLRISGQPLKPLAGPIFDMFGEMLQHVDDPDQIDCFHVQMRNIGKMLSEIDKVCLLMAVLFVVNGCIT